jgi:hypothetical protein
MRRARQARAREGKGFAIAAAIAASTLAAPPASAGDTEPIRIVFRAPGGCPDAAEFTGQVQARTAMARLAAPGEPARTFTVVIDTAGRRSHGKLTLDDPHGPGSVREVSAERCAEIVSALALVTALAIDPRASTAPTPAPRPAPPPAPPPARRAPPLPPPRPLDAPLPWWGPIGPPLPVIPGPAPAPGPRWRFGSGLHTSGESALAPSMVFVDSGFLEVMRTTGGVVSPAIRLSFLKADSGFVASQAGASAAMGAARARFRFIGGRLEGCPVHLELPRGLAAIPCVIFDAGAVDAEGRGRFASERANRPWAAPGLLGRLQAAFVDRVFIELEGGVNFPLVRDTFYFDPTITAHAVPAAGGFLGGGVGMHFP